MYHVATAAFDLIGATIAAQTFTIFPADRATHSGAHVPKTISFYGTFGLTPAPTGIHRSERIAKLEDFAVAQEHDSMGLGAVELRQLAAELVADTVDIPSEVTHNQIEDWSFGNGPKLWTTKLKVAG